MAPYAAATDALEFYATAQPMTAVPESSALEGLPDDPGGLASVVRGALVHRDWAPLMGLELPAERVADQHIRPVAEVIDRILALWPAPLHETREPERRDRTRWSRRNCRSHLRSRSGAPSHQSGRVAVALSRMLRLSSATTVH